MNWASLFVYFNLPYDTIYHYIAAHIAANKVLLNYWTKNIIHHINVVNKPPNFNNLFSSKTLKSTGNTDSIIINYYV